MRKEAHSAKALETLRLMDTKPEDWQLTPIKWVREKRMAPALVKCPVCNGNRYVCKDAEGNVIPPPALVGPRSYEEEQAFWRYLRDAKAQARGDGGNCTNCIRRNRWGGTFSSGSVQGLAEAEILVGYPQFPDGIKFDSRFHSGCNCNLCNKLVLKSNLVPVHGKGSDGTLHGMWVGVDCARKFLKITLKREKNAIIETASILD